MRRRDWVIQNPDNLCPGTENERDVLNMNQVWRNCAFLYTHSKCEQSIIGEEIYNSVARKKIAWNPIPWLAFSLCRSWAGFGLQRFCLLRNYSRAFASRSHQMVPAISVLSEPNASCCVLVDFIYRKLGWVRLSSRRLKYHFCFCVFGARPDWLMIDARTLWVKCFVFFAHRNSLIERALVLTGNSLWQKLSNCCLVCCN